MNRIVALYLLVSLQAAMQASATTTIYSVSYSGETAGMAGVANATEEDALSQAINPANLTRIGDWRFDVGVGYLISRVTCDDGGVNPDQFGHFEYNEGHDFIVPGIAYAQRVGKGPWVLGLAAYGNGGDAILFRDLRFNDVSPSDLGSDAGLGGPVSSFMTRASDPAGGFGGLTEDNGARRDNYATLQSGKVAATAAVAVTPELSLAVSPVLDIGVLRFGTYGNFNTARNPATGAFDGDYTTQVRGTPFAEFGNTQVTFADLFAGDTFPKMLLDGGGQSGADGATRIAGLFQTVGGDPTFGPALVGDLTTATVVAAGGAMPRPFPTPWRRPWAVSRPTSRPPSGTPASASPRWRATPRAAASPGLATTPRSVCAGRSTTGWQSAPITLPRPRSTWTAA
jgi:hypothetical protein